MDNYYLKIGIPSDLKKPAERALFRFFEILPGLLSWLTLLLVGLLSWLTPFVISFFIIAFTMYWLFRSVYFSFHLESSYRRMRENENTNWIEKLDQLSADKYSLPIASWKDVYHIVLLPISKESLQIAKETFWR